MANEFKYNSLQNKKINRSTRIRDAQSGLANDGVDHSAERIKHEIQKQRDLLVYIFGKFFLDKYTGKKNKFTISEIKEELENLTSSDNNNDLEEYQRELLVEILSFEISDFEHKISSLKDSGWIVTEQTLKGDYYTKYYIELTR
jgi:hypothetical protein